MRQCCVRSCRNNRIKRRLLESRPSNPPIDVQRDFHLRAAPSDVGVNFGRHLGQPTPGLPQDAQLVRIFYDAHGFDQALGRNQRWRGGRGCDGGCHPCVAGDRQMRGFDADARTAHRLQHGYEGRVVGALDRDEFSAGTLVRASSRFLYGRDVSKIGDEIELLACDNDDRGAARKVREIQDVGQRRDHERVEREFGEARAHALVPAPKGGGWRVRHESPRERIGGGSGIPEVHGVH